MIIFLKRYYKHVAVLLAVALVVQLFIFFPFGKAELQQFHDDSKSSLSSDQDSKIAADISNLTGVRIEEIMQLKATGKSWNEVLELLKSRNISSQQSDKEQRNKLLAGVGIEEDDIKKWLEQGYTNQEITEARMMADRVQFQLKELSEESPFQQVDKPSAELTMNKTQDDKKMNYQKINEGFSVKMAVSYMLQLKKELGSVEAVLDEYLLSLQIEVSLEQYMTDKTRYLKQKEEKSIGILRDQIITLSVIEQDVMNKIKKDSTTGKENSALIQGGKQDDQSKDRKNPLPDVPVPNVKDVRPISPAEEIKSELKRIDPNQR